MFQDYDKKIGGLLEGDRSVSWEKVLKNHKMMILRIQHERIIHLLVTVFVGLVMVISFLTTIVSEKFLLLFLDVPLLILFVAYIFHYRFLENTAQKWYRYEDDLTSRLK